MNKFILVGKNIEEIEKFMVDNNQSKYRARQIFNWLYLKSADSYDKMTDLPVSTRELLKEKTGNSFPLFLRYSPFCPYYL